jgi:pimeloyl-ACP methyl ester carboxylesterase
MYSTKKDKDKMETADRSKRQIKLSDGRMLGYDEHGDPDGKPIIFMHGFPGSRLDWRMFDPDDSAAELKARIIAVDRPGMGLSDIKRGRELLDWPDDVTELMNALQVAQFAVLALSGGGPYGEVCAFKIPERLTSTAIVCGMGPRDAPGSTDGGSWTLPGKPSLIRRVILTLMAQTVRKQPERMEPQFLEMVSEPDRELLQNQPELLKMSLDSWGEAFRSGTGGVQREADLYKRPWGFRLQDISTKVHLWHGENDNNVPGSVGHYVANAIPDCQAVFYEEEGHFSLPYKHMNEILNVLVG